MLKTIIGLGACAIALAGCQTTNTPIVAGAVDQIGITASSGLQDQGANMTLGYRGAKFAVVPVQTSDGKQLSLRDGSVNKEKGFSVIAVLGLDKTTASTPSIGGIEQVVAVGPAADIYAAGRARLTLEQARTLGIVR